MLVFMVRLSGVSVSLGHLNSVSVAGESRWNGD